MKQHEEMLKDLHRRMDEYEADQRAKRAKITKVAASVTPVCAAAVVGVGLWKGGALTPHNDQLISSTIESTASDEILSADNDTSADKHSANNNTDRNGEPTTSVSATDRQTTTADNTIPRTTENGERVATDSGIDTSADKHSANNNNANRNGEPTTSVSATDRQTTTVDTTIPRATENGERVATDSGTENASSAPADSVNDSGHQVIWAEDMAAVNEFCEDFTVWHKFDSVGYRLYEALDSGDDDDIFAILARPALDYTFTYNGKTVAEYYSDMCNERNLPEILAQLQKEGDALKYGEALYQTGTPSGEKWAQSWYEERIRYYGDAVLGKYIVNGEFLSEKLEQDIAEAKTRNTATEAYRKALGAYLEQLAASVGGELPAEAVPEQNGIIMYLTKAEFSVFSPDGIDGWTFDLAFKDGETTYQYGIVEDQ